jgi:hypothetical protein
MKVALILASNTRYAPYIYHYVRILKEENVDFDIFIWNKENLIETNCISYDEFTDIRKSRLYRIASYFRYSNFIRERVNNKEYQKIVVFTVFLGVLLYPYLQKKFRKKYFFDIRDYSPILKFSPMIIDFIVKNSYKTIISSSGFLKWLPPSTNYVLSHNYSFDNHFKYNSFQNINKNNITILTIGFLRDFETNKMLIDSCKNNAFYTLKFVGNGISYEPLMKYVAVNDIKNVVFTGAYDKENELDYLKNVTLMNILLGDDVNSRTLLTNRLYLAIGNGIPVLVNDNSVQAEYVKKYKLGLIINADSVLCQSISNYFDKFNREEFLQNCANFLSDITIDQVEFEMSFKKFISNY